MAVGGVAEIYLARARTKRGGGRVVVVKRLLPALAREPELSRMLLAEATIVSVLEHPNIVQVLDLGTVTEGDGTDYFVVMEYVHGRDLADLLGRLTEKNRRLPMPVVFEIAQAIACGLAYAHGARDYQGRPLGIVHRDMSPHNVLVSFGGDVKISDFGIAKFATDDVTTEAGVFKGKFRYMSPEQAARKNVDHRSDIFSLGILLWEMIAGETLFAAKSLLETVERVRKARVPDLREKRPEVPAAIAEVVKTALARKVHERFQSAEAIGVALESAGAALPRGATTPTLADVMREQYSDAERALPKIAMAKAREGETTAARRRETGALDETMTKTILGRAERRAESAGDVSFVDLVLEELKRASG